jgi:hypothetical protein
MNEIEPRIVAPTTTITVSREKYLLPSEKKTTGIKARTKG